MDEIKKTAAELKRKLDGYLAQLKMAELEADLQKLSEESKQPDFWDNQTNAQEVSKRISKFEARLEPWHQIQTKLEAVTKALELDDAAAIKDDLADELKEVDELIEARKDELKLSGPYDERNAIISLYAGAGGVDAQDWTEMLLRMYVRWAEKRGYSVKTIDQSAGDEAGIKSATLEISGDFAYGKLKGENGVHRLVRLSPFNADNLRQTSFAKVDVLPVIDQPDELAIDDKDLRIDVYRSGGHGGQSVNTTDSAVRITHLPTGITVAIQNERSQLQNKEMALTILRSRLTQLQLEQHAEKLSEIKGPNEQAAWGNQIRSYVLHPYKQVKDLRSGFESSDPDAVLNGELDGLINAYLEKNLVNN